MPYLQNDGSIQEVNPLMLQQRNIPKVKRYGI